MCTQHGASNMWGRLASVLASIVGQGRAEEEGGDPADHQYAYPTANGEALLGGHFLMGTDKFDIVPADNLLFGDNGDINFLGPSPTSFPFEQTQSTEPLRPLQCLVNVRRDSVRFVRVTAEGAEEEGEVKEAKYRVQFTIDADVPCEWRVFYNASVSQWRDKDSHRFSIASSSAVVGPFTLPVGVNMRCDNDMLVLDASQLCMEGSTHPVIIELCTATSSRQSQLTLCTVSQSDTSGFVLKPVKQKLLADGVVYLLHEVFGIENKLSANTASRMGEDGELKESASCASMAEEHPDNSMDCVICMCELRDTLIIPCRHLCLCSSCAETLRFKLSNCPICRSPFRALLQMRTLRKVRSTVSAPSIAAQIIKMATPNKSESCEPKSFLTTRYDYVPLVVALNGAVDQTQTCVTTLPSKQHKKQSTRHTHRRSTASRNGAKAARPAIQQVIGAPSPTVVDVVNEAADTVSDQSDVFYPTSEHLPTEEEEEEDVKMETESVTPRSNESADSASTLVVANDAAPERSTETSCTQETEC